MQKFIYNILERNRIIFILLVTATFTFGCSEFFVKDLSGSTPILIIPINQDTIINNTIHFKWEEMEGAENYKLQVVSPNFGAISSYPLDSLITTTEFFYSLPPGQYEYRLRGENSASVSQFSEIRSFQIDSTSDLSSLTLILTSPSNGLYTNETNPTLIWQDLYPADTYLAELRQGTSWFTATSIESGNSLSSFYSISSNLSEGNYLWQITASNALPSSSISEQRSLYVDLTEPGTPSLTAPADLGIFADTVLFSWNQGSNNGGTVNAPRFDSIYIFTDSILPFNSELTRGHSTSQSYTYIFQNTSSPYYYWRVRTLDEAGNKGGFSVIRRVSIQ